MDFNIICTELNSLAADFKIGELQSIRKKIKGLSRKPTDDIFTWQSIFKDYAFHIGGRSELQFNIGYYKKPETFRYGLAFSLETNRSLQSEDILIPKIKRFNSYLKKNPAFFSELHMYYDDANNGASDIVDAFEIPKKMMKKDTFIFIGKFIKNLKEGLTYEDYLKILRTFDDLLDLYVFVESENELETTDDYSGEFNFSPGLGNFKKESSRQYSGGHKRINLVHKEIQENLYYYFVKKYNTKNVAVENPTGYGTSVDLIVKEKSQMTFYEVKTGDSVRQCIREALPQLLEYSYYPDKNRASKLIIVSENNITEAAEIYLRKLRKDFSIPVYYQRYDSIQKSLEKELF